MELDADEREFGACSARLRHARDTLTRHSFSRTLRFLRMVDIQPIYCGFLHDNAILLLHNAQP